MGRVRKDSFLAFVFVQCTKKESFRALKAYKKGIFSYFLCLWSKSTAKSLDQHIKKNCKHPDIEEYRANVNNTEVEGNRRSSLNDIFRNKLSRIKKVLYKKVVLFKKDSRLRRKKTIKT